MFIRFSKNSVRKLWFKPLKFNYIHFLGFVIWSLLLGSWFALSIFADSLFLFSVFGCWVFAYPMPFLDSAATRRADASHGVRLLIAPCIRINSTTLHTCKTLTNVKNTTQSLMYIDKVMSGAMLA